MKTQNQKIEQLLRKGQSITALQALRKFNCFRLAARISDLKNNGMLIKTDKVRIKKGTSIARYSLI